MQQQFQEKWLRIRERIIANELLLALCVVIATSIVGIVFGLENNKLIPINIVHSAHYLLEPRNRLSFLANWDGRDYLDIAVNGYRGPIQTNFFPLYPLLIRLVNFVVGSPLWSALIVSWAAFVGAVYFYMKIVKQLYRKANNLEALRSALFFVLFPTGVFLFSAYTESLFAFLSLGAIYFALKKRPFEAGALLLLATATHENGVCVLVLIALLLWEQHESYKRIAASVGIGCLGIVGYMVYLLKRFDNPLQFVSSQKSNGWLTYSSHLLNQLAGRDGLFLLLVLISILYWWRRRKSFAIYSALYACIMLLGNLGGYGRYVLMDFPIQLMFYDYFRNKNFKYALVLAAFAAFWMYFLLQFAGGYTGG